MSGQPLEAKAVTAVIEELERQAAENPTKLSIRRSGETVTVNGEINVDAVVMWSSVRRPAVLSASLVRPRDLQWSPEQRDVRS